jgi:hypothetical protein
MGNLGACKVARLQGCKDKIAIMRTSIYGFLLTGIVLLLSICLNAQTNTSWFTVNEVSEKVWVLSDHNIENIYLIEGRDSALLIDTGIGAADLASAVKKLTDKPLIVIITHGHPDHCGSNYQFEKVYVHPADSGAARMFNLPETRAGMSAGMNGDAELSPEDIYTGEIYNTRMLPLEDGQIFNLGGRFIKVMETPGHTPGEPGHGPQMPSDFILDQISCVKAILDGTCEVRDYKSFAGDSKICTYGRASVAFNPENL